jgi:hypothetical protein
MSTNRTAAPPTAPQEPPSGTISIYPLGYAVSCAECGDQLRRSPFESLAGAFYEAIAHARDDHGRERTCPTAWSSALECEDCGARPAPESVLPDPERGYWLPVHERASKRSTR